MAPLPFLPPSETWSQCPNRHRQPHWRSRPGASRSRSSDRVVPCRHIAPGRHALQLPASPSGSRRRSGRPEYRCGQLSVRCGAPPPPRFSPQCGSCPVPPYPGSLPRWLMPFLCSAPPASGGSPHQTGSRHTICRALFRGSHRQTPLHLGLFRALFLRRARAAVLSRVPHCFFRIVPSLILDSSVHVHFIWHFTGYFHSPASISPCRTRLTSLVCCPLM